jgi:transposase
MSCYEAGYDGFWLHRVLEAHGIHTHVLDPASLQVNRRARRPKTDRIDADRMVRALIRHLRGEPEACSVIRVPSPEQEDARRLHRERDRLIAERVAHVNRVKGLCATQGIYDYQPLRSDRLKRLEKLRTGDGRALAPRLKAEIVREIKRLEVVLEMILTVEAERDAIFARAAKSPPLTRGASYESHKRVTGAEPHTAVIAVNTRGGSRMRESRTYGSVRGARGNSRPYREGIPCCTCFRPLVARTRRKSRDELVLLMEVEQT